MSDHMEHEWLSERTARPVRQCPRCHVAEPEWRGHADVDGRKCMSCGQFSSNAEIARGKPWTQDEIGQMLAHMNDQPAA